MSKGSLSALDENTRRYYLDVMGIQCWELLGVEADVILTGGIDVAQETTEDTGFQQLETTVQQCKKCSLHANRKQAIFGRGNLSADLLFVLLAPGSVDDVAGLLCSGEAETLFAKMLAAIDIAFNDVYITSLLKCNVPEQHTVSTREIAQCSHFLKQQVSLVQPKLMVVLGDTAARCLLQNDLPLDELRARNADLESGLTANSIQYESVPVFVSYSPQELLAQPANKRKAWQDLQQIQTIIRG